VVSQLFDEELDRLLREGGANGDSGSRDTYKRARDQSEGMVLGILQSV
jgi:hypothetical protein